MKVTPSKIPDVKLIKPDLFQDEPGFFYEFFNQQKFINVAVDSSKNTIETNAGEYPKNISLDNNQSIKLINAERVGYYAGISISDLMSATEPELQNTQIIIFNGRANELTKFLEKGYQFKKGFIKNKQGVYILRRISSD